MCNIWRNKINNNKTLFLHSRRRLLWFYEFDVTIKSKYSDRPLQALLYRDFYTLEREEAIYRNAILVLFF